MLAKHLGKQVTFTIGRQYVEINKKYVGNANLGTVCRYTYY